MSVIDTHVHLNEFSDVDSAIKRAKAAGVKAIIAVGVDHASNVKTLQLSTIYKNYVFPAFGIHPWEVEGKVNEGMTFIRKRVDECVAIGEIGLDYWIKTDPNNQKPIFKDCLKLAVNHDKVVCIHSRGAWEDAYTFVKDARVERAVFHWYSGPLHVLRKILQSGYFISATPAAEYSKPLREALQHTPIENILLETDSPVKYKGVAAEPTHVFKTLQFVAKLKGVSENLLAEKTTENAINFFSLSL